MDRTILLSLCVDQEEDLIAMDIAMKPNAVLGILQVEMKIFYLIRLYHPSKTLLLWQFEGQFEG